MISEFPRWTYFLYFFTHIPITICIDLQGVLGSLVSYPETLVNLFNWYITKWKVFISKNKFFHYRKLKYKCESAFY